MFRLLAFILFFISFSSFSQYFTVEGSLDGSLIGRVCAADNISSCYSLLPETYNGKPLFPSRTSDSSNPTRTHHTIIGRYKQCVTCSETAFSISLTSILTCTSAEQCEPMADGQCTNEQVMHDYNFTSADTFTFECADQLSDQQQCENTVTQQCSGNGGFATSNFIDNGEGSSSCSGTCGDGSVAGAGSEPDCIETPENNYCDIPDPGGNSDIDFGSGGSGSDVLPPSSSSGDVEHDIDYEPDGSMADPTAPFSALQGDKLINEVVKSRNDNTENLVATTDTTNQTIVEKSDDISNTVSNSANGIIDAINDIPPFYDGNIVQGMEQFSVKIDNLADIFGNLKEDFGELKDDLDTDLGTDYVHTTQHASFASFDALFSADSGTQLEELVEGLQLVIKTESLNFQAALKDSVSIGSPSVGEYEQKSLELSGWGTFDISLSRFTALFGGLGNIIYFLAAMTAMTIVLGGIRL